MRSAVVRLLRSHGYRSLLGVVLDGLEVDVYGVKASRRGPRGLIVEMKVLYRDSIVRQVEARRRLAHRVYVALPDWSVYEALSSLPDWVGIITYDPCADEAQILRKAIPSKTILADLIATAVLEELGEAPGLNPRGGGRAWRMKRP